MTTRFEMYSGDTRTLTVTVRDTSGAAVDLTGATARWALAKKVGQAALVSKSTGSGIELTDAANGEFTVTLDPADTADLVGDYWHEAEVTDSAGRVVTVFQARASIKQDINE